jgi:hypothetical protein
LDPDATPQEKREHEKLDIQQTTKLCEFLDKCDMYCNVGPLRHASTSLLLAECQLPFLDPAFVDGALVHEALHVRSGPRPASFVAAVCLLRDDREQSQQVVWPVVQKQVSRVEVLP